MLKKQLFIWFVAVMLPSLVFGQGAQIDIKGKIDDLNTGSGISGVTISLYKDGSLIETVTTASNGKYKFKKTSAEGVFTIKFSKGGYVGKYAEVDTRGIHPEDAGELPLEVNTSLFENVPGVDFSILDSKPAAKAKYDKSIDNIAWDINYIEKTKKEVDKIIAKAEEEKKKQEAEKAAQEKKFNDAVAAGNVAMSKNDFTTAITKFEEALTVKDDADVKKKRDDAIEKKKLADAGAETDKKYNELMADAKKFFDAKDYGSAKAKYEDASKTKPAETLPKEKIKEIEGILKKQMEDETAYNKLLDDGKKSMLAEKYDDAIKQFTDASKMRPAEQFPKDELKKAQDAKALKDKADADAKKKEEDFAKFVSEGDKNVGVKKYDDAITNYDKALAIKDDAGVKKKKEDAIKAKESEAKAQEEAAEKKRKQEEFDKLMVKGNGELTGKKYDEAIATFETALTVITNEPTAVAKLAEAKKLKTEADKADELAKQQKEKFDALMQRGEQELNGSEYDKAIVTYKEALGIFKDDANAKTKLAEAEKKKADYAKNKAEFDKLVTEADAAVKVPKYDEAITKYEKALVLFDDNGVRAKLDKAKEEKDKALADAEKEKQKKAEFDKFIAQGDGKVKTEDFDGAITDFEEALKIIANEPNAVAKLNDAKKKRDDKLKANELAEAQKKKKEEFDALMTKGDGEMSASDFAAAIDSYTKALGVIPNEPNAKKKLDEATKKKADADKLAKDKDAEFAKHYNQGMTHSNASEFQKAITEFEAALGIKPDDQKAKDALADAKKRLDEYNALKDKTYNDRIAMADKLFNEGNYSEAKGYYEKASNQRPEETHPKNRITECETKIREKEAADADAKKKRELYETAKVKGDGLFNAGKWQDAIDQYTIALTHLPNEEYPKNKIEEAQKKIDEAKNAALAEKEKKDKFDEFIRNGDADLKAEEFDNAISNYQSALDIFSDNPAAKAKLEDAKKKKEEWEKKNAALADQKKKKEDFEKLIAQGDGEMTAQTYDAAVNSYTEALKLFPLDVPAKTKLNEAIKKKKEADLAAQNDAAAQKKREEEFAKHYNQGMTHSNASDFQKAINEFEAALVIKPEDQKAKDALADAKKRLDDYNALKDKTYNDRIAMADKLFDEKKYEDALNYYQKASNQRPEETHPKDRITEINKIIKDQAASDAEAKRLRDAYNQAMSNGNTELSKKNFDKAISYYENAKIILPNESEPDVKIEEAKRLKQQAKDDMDMAAKKKKFDQLMAEGQTYMNQSDFDNAIDKFEAALDVIENEPTAVKALELAKKRQKEIQEEREREYARILEFANKEFSAENWKDAKKYYEKYLKFKKDDPYAIAQIAICEQKMAEADAMLGDSKRYDKLISEGNEYFSSGDYSDARKKYVDALAIFNHMEYPKKKIEEIDKMGRNTNVTTGINQAQNANQGSSGYIPAQKINYGDRTSLSADEALSLLLAGKLDDERNKYAKIQKEKDKISSNNELAANSSEESRNNNNSDLSDYKEKVIDFNNNDGQNKQNEIDYKLKKEEFEKNHIEWNAENQLKKDNKANIQHLHDVYDMGAYEEKLRFINSDILNEDKDEIASKQKEMDDMSDNTRNTNGDNLISQRDQRNGEFSSAGEKMINQNGEIIKSDHDKIASENKYNQELSSVNRDANGDYMNTQKDNFANQNKNVQNTLLEENAESVKNAYLNRHEENRNIDKLSSVTRDQNYVIQKDYEEAFVANNKSIINYRKDESAYLFRTAHDEEAAQNQKINQTSADVRLANGTDLQNQKDSWANNTNAVQDQLESQSSMVFRNAHDEQNNQNKNIDQLSADTRNMNGENLLAVKDEFANSNKNNQQFQLDENGNIIRTTHEKVNDLQSDLDAKSATTRNENANELDNQKEKLKEINDKGALSPADNVRKLQELQNKNAANQKKADQQSNAKHWETKDDLAKKGENAVYEKGMTGYHSQLTVDYPEGMTEEVFTRKDGNDNITEVTVRRIVVKGEYGNEYRKTVNKSGTYYFKNGVTITAQVWDTEAN